MNRAMEAVMRLVLRERFLERFEKKTSEKETPHSKLARKSASEPVSPATGEDTKRDQMLKRIGAGDFIYW